MKLNDFKLECYFGQYEFTAPYLLTQSDCESMTTNELLSLEPGAKEDYLNQWLGYTETWGDPELRELIAGLYKGMAAEDILVFHGAQEAIFGYMNVMLQEGDHMIAMYPNYQSAYEVANSVPNCEFSKWYIKDDGEKWTLDFDELERLIKPNTKVLAVNSPNNPTGYTFTNAEIKKLCEICKRYDLYLFADEVYKGLEMDGEKREWMADEYDKCVSLGVMSKAYGLAGLRVGWLASKDHEVLENVVKFKHYMSICDSAPSEFLSKVALKHSDELLQRSIDIIQDNLKLVDEFFERYPNLFEKKAITCGPVAYHKLLIDMPVKEFCQLAVDKKGVLLLPSDIYGMDDQYFRMGYGRKGVPESLAKFEEFLIEEKFV
ncbi:aminotransferase class I/II-fold pyridoxal phosphate-dependent enzyme [Sinanaerobacter sp. ZZT-01]|uniref:aminotransferase class I/II-fold pyridoxal phosphate-dependent enzyme n=1 Tax=Sinanaerobacter sp. ZZT-01 TaxID=3111540 RepID=UPI002D78E9CF|nr:aminotransferase class I/II-fold pyridoxal phosphate-dependent enzyme [Sinanaerobacter sp. ZZT-01]WRR92154.1 aminotransferase class I/II-fold pyridoxal phosphate-dependent enzyme [Sinanaerobacter sp. ZZT-01]